MAEPTGGLRVTELADAGVIITGGTSGVGLATARHFAAAGSRRIALIGRNPDRGAQAQASLLQAWPDATVSFISADANHPDQAQRAAETARAAIGEIDVLVNSTVGPYIPRLFHDTTGAEVVPALLQQLLAPIMMSRAVLPWMRARRGGTIVNIASDAAKVPTPGETLIGAAMAAIVMFSRTLAVEAKRDGVRVHALTPSLIADTPTYHRNMDDAFSAKLFGKAVKLAHLGVAVPDDLAGLIVFLASPQAARMTGQVISVNGGISIG